MLPLALLRFADLLRRSADRLCHEAAMAARTQGASWRQVGSGRWDYAAGRGTPVQSSGQGTSIENVEDRMVRKKASGSGPVIHNRILFEL